MEVSYKKHKKHKRHERVQLATARSKAQKGDMAIARSKASRVCRDDARLRLAGYVPGIASKASRM